MKVLRETRFEFGYQTSRARPPRTSLTVVVKGTFRLVHEGVCELADAQRPMHGGLFHDDDPEQSLRFESDLALLKPRGEIQLAGHCHPPSGRARVSAAGFRVGSVARAVAVFGDRRWSRAGSAGTPEPFERMPLRWERAFGGLGFAENPLGTGLTPDALMPNLEDPAALLTAFGQRPSPVCFAPIAPQWAERLARAGTYDQAWRATRWPYLPDDFDWEYFNAAPRAQRLDGFFRGDEEVFLQNLCEGQPQLRTRLPGVRARCFLDLTGKNAAFREVRLAIDTVCIDADAGLLSLTWRGLFEGLSPELAEVAHLVLLDEPFGPARAADAVRVALFDKLRRDEETIAQGFIAEAPAPRPRAPLAPPPGTSDDEALEQASRGRARVQEALQRGESLADLSLAGADLSALDLSGRDLSGARLQGARFTGALLVGADFSNADLRGVDFSDADLSRAVFTRALAVSATFERARMRGAKLAGAVLHYATLRGCDLTEADLSRAELLDADLSKSALSRASLVRAELDRADLTEADLSSAHLHEASLRGAVLQRATLEDARVDRTKFIAGCDLRGARMARIEGARTLFHAARLGGAHAAQARLTNAEFSQAQLSRAVFDEADLRGARFRASALDEASLRRARLAEATFANADLRGADLRGADLYACEATGARLDGARFERALLSRSGFEVRS